MIKKISRTVLLVGAMLLLMNTDLLAQSKQNDNAEPWYMEGDYAPTMRIMVEVKNPLPVAHPLAPVVIKRDQLPFWDFGPREIVVVDPGSAPRPEPTREEKLMFGGHLLRGEKNGVALQYQLDDLDRDGIWDELFFQVDLAPSEKRKIALYIGYNNRGMYSHATFAAVGDYGRHPVPMWESEYLTWKLWYPTDVDIQVKRQKMLNGYYSIVNNMSGYHFSYDKGTDIMTVSSTFGAGGIGVFENGLADSVSRPRFGPFQDKGPLHNTRYVHEVVSSGPIRSIVRVLIRNWHSGVGEYEVEQLYTAIRGKYYSTCRVSFPKWMPPSQKAMYAAGIRRIMYQTDSVVGKNFVVSIARNMPVIDPNPETIDRYRSTLDYAATALVVKSDNQPQYQFIRAFDQNHSFGVPANARNEFEYLIAAGWHDAPDYRTVESFVDYVQSTAKEFDNQPQVSCFTLEYKNGQREPIRYWTPPRNVPVAIP